MALTAGCNTPDIARKAGPVIYAPTQPKDLASFDHVVVLMLENRSFDNLLGYLYEPGAVPRGESFEGVWGKDLYNPIPPHAAQAHRQVVLVHQGTDAEHPKPDPGETYPHVHTQLYGTPLTRL
jgi:phospholipase C